MAAKPMSRYKQIEGDIMEKITLGYYLKDTLIPTEQELAKHYNVSRVTIRKATEGLIAQGILEPISGVGTFVRGNSPKKNVITLTGFTKEMKSQNVIPHTKVSTFSLQSAQANIAKVLGIEAGDPIYYFERLRYGDDKLFIIEKTHMSASLYPDISLKVLENSKYDYFESTLQRQIAYSNHVVNPCLSSKSVSKLFEIPENTPIVTIANTTYLDNGQVMDFTELTFNSPHYQLTYTKKR